MDNHRVFCLDRIWNQGILLPASEAPARFLAVLGNMAHLVPYSRHFGTGLIADNLALWDFLSDCLVLLRNDYFDMDTRSGHPACTMIVFG